MNCNNTITEEGLKQAREAMYKLRDDAVTMDQLCQAELLWIIVGNMEMIAHLQNTQKDILERLDRLERAVENMKED